MRILWQSIIVGFLLLGVDTRPISAAEWVWGPRQAKQFDTEARFTAPQDTAQLVLTVAADFCDVDISLNGESRFRVNASAHQSLRNLSPFLSPGENEIRFNAVSTGGPAAIAYELVVHDSEGNQATLHASGDARTRSSDQWQSYGNASDEPWWSTARRPSVDAFDEYNQWTEGKSKDLQVSRASFDLLDGFEIEQVFDVGSRPESWVSMEIDSSDRILLGNERAGILRLTLSDHPGDPPHRETIDDQIKGVHGLLLTDDALWASANRSKALFRLARNKDAQSFGEPTQVLQTVGSDGDHGRHDVVRDDAGRIYVVHGDSIQVPAAAKSLVPLTHEFDEGQPKDGHILRLDTANNTWEVFCSGLRNPYGLAWNHAGELFTYDADAERHTGLPWYRPTRIIHLMPGVDYGWRHRETPWPAYLPDVLPPIARIGRCSPTSLRFGYASQFPERYRDALFALDWSYGRVLAVHVVPSGASYVGHAEVFLQGRPFSVCDLGFLSDGSMLVLTGGRDIPSRIYRLRYDGPMGERKRSKQIQDRESYSASARKQRRELEARFDDVRADAIEVAWRQLSHKDAAIQSAARILLERQPHQQWSHRAMSESDPDVALPALLALTRVGSIDNLTEIHRRLLHLPLESPYALQVACRIESLIDQRHAPTAKRSSEIRDLLESRFPSGELTVDRELCRLLVDHKSETVVPGTLRLYAEIREQTDQFHFLVCLADAKVGWTPERHDAFFRLLEGARRYITDEGLEARLNELFDLAIEQVPEKERNRYAELFSDDQPAEPVLASMPHVETWTTEKIMASLESVATEPDSHQGRQIFRKASCDRCHRYGNLGRAFGPDLTTVGARFGRKHLVEQLVEPSKTISSQYQNYHVVLEDGRSLTGQVVYNGFRKSIVRIATNPLALNEATELRKRDIESVEPSPVSPMPSQLLDTLTIEEIAHLLAFLEGAPPKNDSPTEP